MCHIGSYWISRLDRSDCNVVHVLKRPDSIGR
jgi:hypothetical protein